MGEKINFPNIFRDSLDGPKGPGRAKRKDNLSPPIVDKQPVDEFQQSSPERKHQEQVQDQTVENRLKGRTNIRADREPKLDNNLAQEPGKGENIDRYG
ncbi:MAG: hypothetical protein COT81_00310 [Candidatus Buchananbacteria bacterium CG10_big_fil_rev_8_21_14_0_10_42_9]|uniref:Uncharacterized protein n=1 Tax=Candidatus Buchananbacteria bacterium CG10_big_fil_rev_8_21_14_0_10_42_9 TaxID=1974526 RepID=A0A2H0W4S7_9BACT|nr:MAG: hypothetical protein COT81_00310 [Candidatus Buchananbacteria bacterium CG10_big_fil_rev_8_21_14_0_10_42_9]